MQTVGFIGVGNVGLEICKKLIQAGYRVLGYRRSSLATFEAAGGVAARSPAHIGSEADIVFSCLPSGDSLDEVVSGANGLIDSARQGQIVAELGSHRRSVKERQLTALGAKGAQFLDGEVSGTPGMIAQKKAPVWIAGNPDAFAKIEPIVAAFTDSCLYFGPFGTASIIKLINNLLVTVNTAAIGEAVSLALKSGVNPDLMIKAITTGSGGSVLFPIRAARMVSREFLPPQGTFEMLSHYFEFINELAQGGDARIPLFDLASDLYLAGMKNGLAQHDVAAIINVIEGLPRRKSKTI